MTKTEIKHTAQDTLMSAMQTAFAGMAEENPEDIEDIMEEMSKQFARVEKLFGYDTGSWSRGA